MRVERTRWFVDVVDELTGRGARGLEDIMRLAAQGDWEQAAATFWRVVGHADPALHTAALPDHVPDREYGVHRRARFRPHPTRDLGAFESGAPVAGVDARPLPLELTPRPNPARGACEIRLEGAGRDLGAGPYTWLLEFVPGFDGLRVPARFLMLVALFLSVLAGLGAAALLRLRQRQVAIVLIAAGMAGILFEAWVAPMRTNQPVVPDARFYVPDPPAAGRRSALRCAPDCCRASGWWT